MTQNTTQQTASKAEPCRVSWLTTCGWAAIMLSIVAVLCLVEWNHLQGHITIGNLDYFLMTSRTKGLPNTLSAWVNGYYPVGIPLLAKLGLVLGVDVARFGRVISVFGGVLCGLGTAALALHLTRSRVFALFAMAFLISTGTLLFYAGYEGSDMLAAGLQVLAIGVLTRSTQNRKLTFLAGIITGLGYLIRYTALITFLICTFYWIALAIYRKDTGRLRDALFYSFGFVVGALPQLCTSWIVKGTPFYMTQTYHIWVKLHSGDDLIGAWGSDLTIGMAELIALDPWRFARNWWKEFTEFWIKQSPPLIDPPLLQFSRAGLLLFVFDRKIRVKYRLLLASYTVGIVTALSIFTVNTRFLLILLPISIISALYAVWRIIPSVRVKDIAIPLNVLALLGLLAFAVPSLVSYARTHEGGPHEHVIETSNRMHTAGAVAVQEIATTNLYHQDVASPTRNPYRQLFATRPPDTLREWRSKALDANIRFIIYDNNVGIQRYPQYQTLLNPLERVPGYTPIWISEDHNFSAYRIESETPRPTYISQVQFENGIELLGYDLATHTYQPEGTGSAIGLYLYWRAAQPVTKTLKIFTHVVSPQGQLLAQDDSIPVLWTHPVEEWQLNEIVIDYHHIVVEHNISSQNATLYAGLYDANSGNRINLFDANGKPAGDSITLTTVTIENSN